MLNYISLWLYKLYTFLVVFILFVFLCFNNKSTCLVSAYLLLFIISHYLLNCKLILHVTDYETIKINLYQVIYSNLTQGEVFCMIPAGS